MTRKNILIIGMLDSVHAARWLSQFTDQEINFYIFPSKKHKFVHPDLIKLTKSKTAASFQIADFKYFLRFHGYIDFFFYIALPKFLNTDMRGRFLNRVLRKIHFEYVHALEIQGAGYLIDEVKRKQGLRTPIILTNWGSDIYFFQELPDHNARIRSALETSTHYSAECLRDYELARQLGFSGIELPCIPNAGGFRLRDADSMTKTSTRSKIIAKAYGGQFGRGDLVVDALGETLEKFPQTEAFLYSVTDDLIEKVENLKSQFPDRVKYSSRRHKLGREALMERFRDSRIYVGASRSDGISTSFLEALTMGCYPIQTDTSCASEWTKLGAVASVVPLESKIIAREIELALMDQVKVDLAQQANFKIANEFLNFEIVRAKALTFYS